MNGMRFITITPARDEENFLPRLIASMTAQTLKPARWIVIDDGSTDATAEILDRAAEQHRWIDVKHLPQGRERLPGGESILMQFLPKELWQTYDAILRIDADISFKPDFAELLATEFTRDARLGIAGATLFEPRGPHGAKSACPGFTPAARSRCTRANASMRSGDSLLVSVGTRWMRRVR